MSATGGQPTTEVTGAVPTPGTYLGWPRVRTLVLVAVGLYLLYKVRSVLPVFVVGFGVAYLVEPLVGRLEARGWRRGYSVGLVYLGVLFIFALVALWLAPLLIAQIAGLAGAVPEFPQRLQRLWEGWTERYASSHPEAGAYLQKVLEGQQDQIAEAAGRALRSALGWVQQSVGALLSFLLVPVISYYFVRDMRSLRRSVVALFPAEHREQWVQAVRSVEQMVGRYLRAQAIVCALVAISATMLLLSYQAAFGVGYGLFLGVLAGLFSIVPFVGPLLTWIVAGAVAYATGTNPVLAAGVTVGTLVILNQVFDMAITPRLMGEAVGVHPLWIIFSMLVCGHVLGIAGILLAVPAAATVQIVLRQRQTQD